MADLSHDWRALRTRYKEETGFELLGCDPAGRVVAGAAPRTDCACGGRSDSRRRHLADQTLAWGETVIQLCCDSGHAMWAVPVLDNNETRGALLVQGVNLEGCGRMFHEQVRDAAARLLDMALASNLLPRATLDLARRRAREEQERFLAIEAMKQLPPADDIRSIYLREEPELLSAIKAGDLRGARAILNRVLTVIYGLGGERMELLKSLVLELVVMMSRAAVEAGADPSVLLGRNYARLEDLSRIGDEEELSAWVRLMLDTLMEQIGGNEAYPNSLLLLRALRHMETRLHEHLGRDEVARVAGISPGHFSKLMTERMGKSFSQLLTQLRVQRAKALLSNSTLPLGDLALDCGFCDQSHLNKVFRQHTGVSPGQWRKEHE